MYLRGIYGVAREAVNFPTQYPLRLAAPEAREHVVEHGAARHLGALPLLEFRNNLQALLCSQLA